MNMKKILAAASASVLAVSAMSAMASASELVVDFVEEWTDFKIIDDAKTIQEGLDAIESGLKVEDIESITITANDKVTKWQVGYDAAAGWTQDGDDAARGANDSVTLSDINWAKGDGLCVKVGVTTSDDDGAFTITVNKKGATPAESTPAESTPAESTPAESTPAESTPAESTPAESKPNTDTGVEGVAAVLGVAVVAAGAMVVAKKRK